MTNHGKKHLHDLQHEQKQFQLERLILFSDAVFAIAITLLVIEIKVPEIEHSDHTSTSMKKALMHMIPEFFGFLLSFVVIGQFWINHHRMFGFAKNYNNRLLWLNLFCLLWIVLVPFSSSLNSKYGNLNIVWFIYCINLFMIAISMWWLFNYIANPKHQLSELSDYPAIRKYARMRNLTNAAVFLSGAVLTLANSLFLSYAARFVLFLIPVVILIINRMQKKENAVLSRVGGTGT